MLTGFDRHDVSPLRYWVHAILPLVYDDSLSYYEVLAKISFKMNEVIEGLNANNEQVEKVTQFTIEQVKNLTEAFNNFQASMLERQEQFETKLLDEQHSFETQLKGDIADWEATTEEKFRQQYEDFEQSETEARNAFEKKITDRQESYEQALTEKENQFETNLTNRFDALESQLQSDLEKWETTTKAELKADIEQWKTDAKQEVLDAIPNVVQETGQSTTDVMSQKASTDTFTHLADRIDLTSIAQGDCDLLPGDGMWHYVTIVSDFEYQNMPPNSGESGAWNTFLYYGSAYTINYDEHDYPAFQLAYVPNSATAAIRVFNDHDGSVKYFESWKLISPILDSTEGVVSDTMKALPASVTIDNFIRFNSEKITVTDFDSVNSRLQYVAISTPFTSALNKPATLTGTENVYYTCIDPGQGTPTQMLFDNTNNRIYYRSMHEGDRGAYVWSEWCAVPHVNSLPSISLTSTQDTLSANVLTNNFAYTQDDDTLVQDFNKLGYAPSWQVVSNLANALNRPSDLRGTESCLYQTVNFKNCSVAEKPAIQQLYDCTNSVLYMRMKPNGKAWGQWFKIQDMTAIINALKQGPSGWDLMYGFAGEYWARWATVNSGNVNPDNMNPITALKEPPFIGAAVGDDENNYVLYNSKYVRMYSIKNDEWITNDNYSSKYEAEFPKYADAESTHLVPFSPFWQILNTDAGSILNIDFKSGRLGGIITIPTIISWQTANVLTSIGEHEWLVCVPLSNFFHYTSNTTNKEYLTFAPWLIGIPNASINTVFAPNEETLKTVFTTAHKLYDYNNSSPVAKWFRKFHIAFQGYDTSIYAVVLYINSSATPISSSSNVFVKAVIGVDSQGKFITE